MNLATVGNENLRYRISENVSTGILQNSHWKQKSIKFSILVIL